MTALLVGVGTGCTNDGEGDAADCGLPIPVSSVAIDEQLAVIPKMELALVVTFADNASRESFGDWYDEHVFNDAAFRSLVQSVTPIDGQSGRVIVFDFDRGDPLEDDACALFAAVSSRLTDAEVQFVAA